jgi:hypothetical protein
MAIYFLTPIDSPPDKIWDLSDPENPQMNIYPNSYEVWIATATNNNPISWTLGVGEGIGAGADGGVVSINNIREGSDFEKGEYSFDDLQIECFNLSGFWTDNIFNSTVTAAEIRIFCRKNLILTPIFYGIIDLTDYGYDDNEHPNNTTHYLKVRKYTTNALSFLKSLEDIPVDDTFRSLIIAGTEGVLEQSSVYNFTGGSVNGYDVEYPLNAQWQFQKLSVIIKKIFQMAGLALHQTTGVDDFSVTCDFTFEQSSPGLIGYTLDQLYIPLVSRFDSDSYGYTVLDGDVDKTEWSWYKYENAAQLLAALLKYFGLIWKINFVVDTAPGITCQINLASRNNVSNTIVLDNVISNSGTFSLNESITSAKVTVMGQGDVGVGNNSEYKLELPFVIMNYSDDAHPLLLNNNNVWNYEGNFLDWIRALYFYDGSKMRFVTDIKNGTTYYHSFTANPKSPLLDFGQAIAEYYCGSDGVFAKLQETLDIEICDIGAALSSAPTLKRYEYLSNGNKFLWNSLYYLIINTEKDLLKNTTKIKAIAL